MSNDDYLDQMIVLQVIGKHLNKQIDIPNLFILTEKHFISLQWGHQFRLALSIIQLPVPAGFGGKKMIKLKKKKLRKKIE